MQQFETLNRQQQPFIQSGYGAMGKLNTLLGIGSRPMPRGGTPMPIGGSPTFSPMPVNGMQRVGMGNPAMSSPKMSPYAMGGQGGSRLSQILMLRAMNGDSEAARIMGAM